VRNCGKKKARTSANHGEQRVKGVHGVNWRIADHNAHGGNLVRECSFFHRRVKPSIIAALALVHICESINQSINQSIKK
jgi:hypothetical protein